jgi:3-oxoacid CoA-transferase
MTSFHIFKQTFADSSTKLLAATALQTGDIPIRLGPRADGVQKASILEPGRPRETRIFNGKTYMMETALRGDVAILRAWKVDESGNCQFR